MTHFTDVDLARWRTAEPGIDADRIAVHVGECAACAARFASMVRARAAAAGPDAPWDGDVSGFVSAADAIVRDTPAPGNRPRVRWTWIALAVAAAALIAISMPLFRTAEAPTQRSASLRGGSVHALTPSGAVAANARFTWSSGIAAARYRVEISGPSGIVYVIETGDREAGFPPAFLSLVQPGVEYSWTVTALSPKGQTLATSERRTFALGAR